MSPGWGLVIAHLVLSVPMWRVLRPREQSVQERLAPWTTSREQLRRDLRTGILNIVWGLGGAALLVLAWLRVW